MKMLSMLAATLLLSTPLSGVAEEKNKTIVITPDQELSYALGAKVAAQWREEGFVVDPDIVAIAIREVQNFGPRHLSTEAGNIAIGIEQDRIRRAKEAVWKETRTAGRAFLKENKKEKDVTTTESGLQYVIHKQGEGKPPLPNSRIIVSYTGTSITKGRIFGR